VTKPLQGHLTILRVELKYVTQLDTMAKSTTTGTVPSSILLRYIFP